MGYRLSWLAGFVGIGYALLRVERLLRPSVDGVPWEIILLAAVVLGAAITWAGIAYRLPWWATGLINAAAVTLTVIRVTVPSTTWFIFPTGESFRALGTEMSFALDVIRTGVAPVIPLSGIVAILAVVFWGMGAVVVGGLMTRRPYLAVLTPLVVYLEFAVMDRRPSGFWTTSFMVVVGFGLLAVAADRRREGTGLLTSGVTRLALVRSLPSLGIVTLTVALVVAVFSASAMADLVPRSGYLEWRASSGLSGEYYGSVSYNPFVGIRQDLISQTNVPIFVAEVEGGLPADRVYWRLLTLDSFDGSQWHVGGAPTIERPEDAGAWEPSGSAFAGPTEIVTQRVTILALQMDWLPAAYAPRALSAQNKAVDRGFRVRNDDASVRFDALTYRGMTYEVVSEVPVPDLNVLSRGLDGQPSVVFAGAVDDEEFGYPGDDVPQIVERELPDAEFYLELPDEMDARIRTQAREITTRLETDFERAIALENFFRTPGNFRYSTAVAPGHGATDLADWLFDPESNNYRTGYCEQFSTSMAVMARSIGIPSRVVLGFTPGTTLEDGRVVIRDRNAHAWVELWMPTQGWVRFDPTPRGDGVNPATTGEIPFDVESYLEIPAAEVPDFEVTTRDPVLFRDEPLPDIPRFAGGGGDEAVPTPTLPSWIVPTLLVGLLLFGLVPLIKWLRRRRRLHRLSEGDVAAAWREIVDRLTDLGHGPTRATTPLEFARETDPAMEPLADAYGSAVYGGGPSDSTVAVASRSLTETEQRITTTYSPMRRLLARYSLSTLIPSWLRPRRGLFRRSR
jgi:transglutaminase-like putative cysteine protease